MMFDKITATCCQRVALGILCVRLMGFATAPKSTLKPGLSANFYPAMIRRCRKYTHQTGVKMKEFAATLQDRVSAIMTCSKGSTVKMPSLAVTKPQPKGCIHRPAATIMAFVTTLPVFVSVKAKSLREGSVNDPSPDAILVSCKRYIHLLAVQAMEFATWIQEYAIVHSKVFSRDATVKSQNFIVMT